MIDRLNSLHAICVPHHIFVAGCADDEEPGEEDDETEDEADEEEDDNEDDDIGY